MKLYAERTVPDSQETPSADAARKAKQEAAGKHGVRSAEGATVGGSLPKNCQVKSSQVLRAVGREARQ